MRDREDHFTNSTLSSSIPESGKFLLCSEHQRNFANMRDREVVLRTDCRPTRLLKVLAIQEYQATTFLLYKEYQGCEYKSIVKTYSGGNTLISRIRPMNWNRVFSCSFVVLGATFVTWITRVSSFDDIAVVRCH